MSTTAQPVPHVALPRSVATGSGRVPRTSLAIAAVFVVLAVSWSAFAVPALVKYPTDLDVTPRYAGTFTLFVDPATAAPLETPTSVPLEIVRELRALGRESGSSRVLVEETITQKAGALVDTTQTNVYVMDRRTLKNVADERAYAFDPSNVVDRSGAYRLNLPFDTSSTSTYEIYKNEIGTTYELRGDPATPATEEAGLRLETFTASVEDVPLDPAYVAELNKLVPLPGSLRLDQLGPQLLAAGIDVNALLAAVLPVITPEDFAILSGVAATPGPLVYVQSFEGRARVEPTTGAEVDVGATESVGAKPLLADLATLQSLIGRYPDVPEAVRVAEALDGLASAPPIELFEFEYEQTPASVAAVAGEVRSMRDRIRLAERQIPFALFGAAALSLAVGGYVYWRRGRTPMAGSRTGPLDGGSGNDRPSVTDWRQR